MVAQETPATVALRRAAVVFTLHPYEHSARVTRFGDEAVAALGLDPDRVFKTLVVAVDDELVVGVVPVSASLDLKALAAAVGGKRAGLSDPAAATRATGYVLGGISPFGQRRRLPTVVDGSARGFGSVYVSAGRRGLQVELDPVDLIRVTGARTAAIAAF